MASSDEARRLDAARSRMTEARDTLEDIISERGDYFQSRSERWQDGTRGQAHADRTSYLETVHANLEDAISTLEEMEA